MKLTKSKLREMISQELKEISGTAGGTKSLQNLKTKKADISTKKTAKAAKKSAWDTAKKTYTTKSSAYDSAASDYTSKKGAVDAFNIKKYQKTQKKGPTLYSKNPAKGYVLNPAWTIKNNAKSAALTTRNTKSAEKDTADSQQSSAETDYDTAVDDMTAAEKAEAAAKAATGFAFGAGGGGRGAGKGGTGKKWKQKESLHRILGREIIKELNDIKKYK